MATADQTKNVTVPEIFLIFLRLGLTSFGISSYCKNTKEKGETNGLFSALLFLPPKRIVCKLHPDPLFRVLFVKLILGKREAVR